MGSEKLMESLVIKPKNTFRALLGLLALLTLNTASAADVNNIRMWLAPDNTRLVFDLSAPVEHQLISLDNPGRIVIDVPDAVMKAKTDQLNFKGSPIKGVRVGKGNPLRIVFDLADKVVPNSFSLAPNAQYGHRLVVDLKGSAKKAEKPAPVVVNNAKPDKLRKIVIAIDAGHGGEDPGAIGPSGTQEKKVVLAIAKELERIIDAEYGYISRMIRRGDYYVSLRGRTQKARQKQADLFVSIHADAFKDARAKGASVWVLSNRGATSEVGRWLARQENSADLAGGVSIDDKDKVLAGVLLDMSMTASRQGSYQVAKKIHSNMAKFAKMHKPNVEKAGFLVLKSPDMPSILVETGFISNPDEERKLRTRAYQKKMARAIFNGIKAFFWSQPPAYTLIDQKKNGTKSVASEKTYRVVKGDSLSRIASRHGVSIAKLRKANGLKGDNIRIGQTLQIPAS